MKRKAMTISLRIVITIVVLLILALLLINLVSTNIARFSGTSDNSIGTTGLGIQCQTELAAACANKESGETCDTGCDSCPDGGSTKCP